MPYLTTLNDISLLPLILFADIKSLSEQSLVAPYKFNGEEALSVDNATTFLIFLSKAASIIFCAPSIFVCIYSKGLYSAVGTCFIAAAWTMHSMSSRAL